jgi:hypothetical protein
MFTSLPAGDCLTTNSWWVSLHSWLAFYRQSARIGAKPLEVTTRVFCKLTLAAIDFMYHPLWREDGSVVYNCCWPSPAKSFSGPSPAGFMTTFYCLRIETPLTWRARPPYLYPKEGSGSVIPPDTGFPFRRLLRLAGLRWRYSTPPPHGMFKPQMSCPRYISPTRTSQKTPLPRISLLLSVQVLIKSLPSIPWQYNDKWMRVGNGLEGRDCCPCEALFLPLPGEIKPRKPQSG